MKFRSTKGDLLVAAFFVLFGVAVVVVGAGEAAAWFRCGAFTRITSLYEPLGFLGSGDVSGFGVTANGCTAEPVAVWSWMIGFVVFFTVAIVLAWKFWTDYKESETYFLKDIDRREGFAKGREIRNAVGEKVMKKKAGKLRPTLDNAGVGDCSFRIGHYKNQPVLVSCEESIVLVGPPRSGKGFFILINAILDAPGSVITTSTRADNYAATASLRGKKGIVTLFDPQGLTGVKSTLKWSPISGCERPEVAARRAAALIGNSGLGQSGNNQEWAEISESIMACLLHAAAIGNKSVDELLLWGNSPVAAKQAVIILESSSDAAPLWAEKLRSDIESDPKMLDSKWMGVTGAVKALLIPSVRETLNPRTAEESFNPKSFIQNKGTLYLVGTKTGGGAIAPYLIALMDEITETAREMAIRLPGNRLDPPMTLVLDEIANMAGNWPGLVNLMADGGGVGISPFVVLQSLAQARDGWGEQQAQAIFDAATVKVQLGGSGNDKDLEVFTKLMGTREVTRESLSWQENGRSTSTQIHDKEVLTVAEMRRIPFGRGLYFGRNGRPIFMELTRWIDRPDKDEIVASIGAFNKSLLLDLTDELPDTSKSSEKAPKNPVLAR